MRFWRWDWRYHNGLLTERVERERARPMDRVIADQRAMGDGRGARSLNGALSGEHAQQGKRCQQDDQGSKVMRGHGPDSTVGLRTPELRFRG
jgi:hypothetical protein